MGRTGRARTPGEKASRPRSDDRACGRCDLDEARRGKCRHFPCVTILIPPGAMAHFTAFAVQRHAPFCIAANPPRGAGIARGRRRKRSGAPASGGRPDRRPATREPDSRHQADQQERGHGPLPYVVIGARNSSIYGKAPRATRNSHLHFANCNRALIAFRTPRLRARRPARFRGSGRASGRRPRHSAPIPPDASPPPGRPAGRSGGRRARSTPTSSRA